MEWRLTNVKVGTSPWLLWFGDAVMRIPRHQNSWSLVGAHATQRAVRFFLAAITSEMVERFGPILTLGYCLLVTLAVAALGFVECWSLAPLW